jgi:hypothetical protein
VICPDAAARVPGRATKLGRVTPHHVIAASSEAASVRRERGGSGNRRRRRQQRKEAMAASPKAQFSSEVKSFCVSHWIYGHKFKVLNVV